MERPDRPEALTPARVWMAVLPYVLVVAVFGIAKLWTLGANVPEALAATDLSVPWPGLHGHLLDTGGSVTSTVYKLQWLSRPGTLLLSGLLVAVVCSVFHGDGRFRLRSATRSGRSDARSGRCVSPR